MARRYGDHSRGVKRAYVSPYRAELARETRSRVLRAAIDLFTAQGYAATSVDAIAEAAGVSRPTVFSAVGSKRELITQARDVALVGDDEPVPMPRRPWVERLRAERDARRAVGIYARAMREVHGRAAAIELAIAAAADADPELRVLADTARRQRHTGCSLVAEALAAKSSFRDGLGTADAADVIFALASPEVYRLTVGVRGWDGDRYESWLATTLAEQLLPSRRRRTPPPPTSNT